MPQGKDNKSADRASRLAAELRENLKKRKDLARKQAAAQGFGDDRDDREGEGDAGE